MPVALARTPRPPPVPGFGEGEGRGDQEADRADRVGPPDDAIDQVGRDVQQCGEGGDVEVQRAHELHQAGPVADLGRLPGEPGVAVLADHLHERQVGGDGEEQRADEERDGCDLSPDSGGVRRNRTEHEAGGADDEQRADPPRQAPALPDLDRPTLSPGAPPSAAAVREVVADLRDERPRPSWLERWPLPSEACGQTPAAVNG